MRVLLLIIIASIFMSSCVTQRGVERYADKHPERMSQVSWDFMNKFPSQSLAYCIAKYPLEKAGTSVEVIIDTAAMDKAIEDAVANAIAVTDSAWVSMLDSTYIPREVVVKGVAKLKAQHKLELEKLAQVLTKQCSEFSAKVIRDTVIDTKKVEYWKEQHSYLEDVNRETRKLLYESQVDTEKYQDSSKKWMAYAIGTWVILALLIASYIVIKIKSRTVGL